MQKPFILENGCSNRIFYVQLTSTIWSKEVSDNPSSLKRKFTTSFQVVATPMPKETINYIPKFIAAKLIGNNPAKYGFTDIEWEKPLEFETVKVDRPVNLKQMAAKLNFDYDDLKQMLNEHFFCTSDADVSNVKKVTKESEVVATTTSGEDILEDETVKNLLAGLD
jgi:hypothetical protein